MFIRKTINKLISIIGVRIYGENNTIARATLPKFGNNPKHLTIEFPRRIVNPDRIFIGDNVNFGPGSLLIAITRYPTPTMRHPDKNQKIQEFNPVIKIGNRVTSTGGLQIASMSDITIEDDVMFASNVNLTDGLHGYENANEPYQYQKITRIAPIKIKKGCWIGQNVVIMPGTTIGEFSIIGANSVVTESIPDRCIAVGAPTRIIKKWDNLRQKWRHVNNVNKTETRGS